MDEVFNPDDYWYSGTLDGVRRDRDLLVFELENQKGEIFKVACPSAKIMTGSHCFCLPRGTPVKVRLIPTRESASGFHVVEVELANSDPQPREKAVITHWSPEKSCGCAVRMCGGRCTILAVAHKSNKQVPAVGDTVELVIIKDRKKLGYVGLIRKISQEETT